ncbi:hypothetical protein JNUCC31_25020 [Paenibacillus sp. JNUCC31]|uniref:hypothetical protein n=1 Tax=Paenibacillus sp. JNUCC-31 TaxID=2777983 RepID=UPI00177A76CC|nr:hypothetical protein [Paenibacillus sp. JNUCC-31]QOS77932.1 hypothetical protein JNUCC31_24780 [Paenibacillus sp. JNUCC-31]QOS77973.1 hypothetical protein JNUCC31_25020 [Paenibacillus sp. JNUCC-31]
MIQQALQKLQQEMSAKSKDAYVQHVGSFLTGYVRNHPEHAAFVLTDGKTIIGSLNAMKEEAKKKQSNGVGVLSDQQGFEIVLKYFGVPSKQEQVVAAPVELKASLDDLL